MKRILVYMLSLSVLLSGCSKPSSNTEVEQSLGNTVAEGTEEPSAEPEIDINALEASLAQYEPEEDPEDFYNLDDIELRDYLEETIYEDLNSKFDSEDYRIENIETVYISREYIEELEYNSKENIFFGYTLSELDEQFKGKRYIFTVDENGETVVQEFEEYSDDSYAKALKNVAIGSGVILVCVTVSVVTGGAGAVPVSMVFAASAKTGVAMALSSGTFSAVFYGTITAIQTGDTEEALKAAALHGSEGFKWGAIAGVLIGGASEASALYRGSKTATSGTLTIQQRAREAELRALDNYGGQEQLTYLEGKEVPWGTSGATRPDVVRTVDGHLEAIEVKYYDLSKSANRLELYKELEREVAARNLHLPPGSTQRIVLDVTGRGFSEEMMNTVTQIIQKRLFNIYPNIPIDIVGL